MPNDSDQHHVVCSLLLDFQMPDREMARAIQERLSQLARGRMLAEAETVFSEVCSPHVTQRLDKLVVNLGVLRSDQLEEAIMERFAPRLQVPSIQERGWLQCSGLRYGTVRSSNGQRTRASKTTTARASCRTFRLPG